MPLINIYVPENKPDTFYQRLSELIHQSLIETWQIPKEDLFQILHKKAPGDLIFDPTMWNIDRSKETILLHITTSPRTQLMKRNFYKKISENLEKELNHRPQDIIISILTNTKEDWSFGNGAAQLLD